MIESLLDIFQEAGMIKINDRFSDFYAIELKSEISLSKATQTIKYAEFIELLSSISEYKNKFMTIDL